MNYATFKIGFWVPFGTYGGEQVHQKIIERKRREIRDNNGWTLWSFRHRTTLEAWYEELVKARSTAPLVFCSMGNGAVDPAGQGGSTETNSFRFVNEDVWHPRPRKIRVPHKFRHATESAFVVQGIAYYPVEMPTRPCVECWFDGRWQRKPIATRVESLSRHGGSDQVLRFRAVLELRAPYLAYIREAKA